MKLKNICDLLRECPEGTKLYSPIFGVVSLDSVNTDGWIKVIPKRTGILQLFYPDGRFSEDGEVMLFPSDTNRNWDNFVIPFKDGDILSTELGSVFILNTYRNDDEHYGCYVGVACNNDYLDVNNIFAYKHVCRYANEDEKQKLFKKIKENGYKWDNVTKVLCKIVEPKFKIGDIIKDKCNLKWKVIDVNSHYYEVSLILTGTSKLLEIKAQDDYELVPKKFDVSKLKPFDKVLTRQTSGQIWTANLFSHKIDNNKKLQMAFVCLGGHCPTMCIPYEGNEHLLGTSNDCDDFYKTWH